jgi:hypothetical protein
MPMGRPTKLTPELSEHIKESLSYGLSFQETAARAKIDRGTLSEWLEDADFASEVASAMAERKLACLKVIKAGKNFFGEAWWLERTDLRWARPELQWAMRLHGDKKIEDPANVIDDEIRSLLG